MNTPDEYTFVCDLDRVYNVSHAGAVGITVHDDGEHIVYEMHDDQGERRVYLTYADAAQLGELSTMLAGVDTADTPDVHPTMNAVNGLTFMLFLVFAVAVAGVFT